MMLRTFCVGAFAAAFAAAGCAAPAQDCGPEALGVSRTIQVGPTPGGRLEPLLEHKEVILTFDDGPDRSRTRRVMDKLDAECVRATFFLIGTNARRHKREVRRILDRGHTIGGHGEQHYNLTMMPHDEALAIVGRGLTSIERALTRRGEEGPQVSITLFRAPFVAMTERLSVDLAANGIAEIGVTVDGKDWTGHSAQAVVDTIMAGLDAGGQKGVILLHDPMRHSVKSTELLLERLKAEQYSIVALEPLPAD